MIGSCCGRSRFVSGDPVDPVRLGLVTKVIFAWRAGHKGSEVTLPYHAARCVQHHLAEIQQHFVIWIVVNGETIVIK